MMPPEKVRRSDRRPIHRSARKMNSANFAKNSSPIHRDSLGYWWGGSQPSLSSSFFVPELLVGYPMTHPLLSSFTRVPREGSFSELRLYGVLRSSLVKDGLLSIKPR